MVTGADLSDITGATALPLARAIVGPGVTAGSDRAGSDWAGSDRAAAGRRLPGDRWLWRCGVAWCRTGQDRGGAVPPQFQPVGPGQTARRCAANCRPVRRDRPKERRSHSRSRQPRLAQIPGTDGASCRISGPMAPMQPGPATVRRRAGGAVRRCHRRYRCRSPGIAP